VAVSLDERIEAIEDEVVVVGMGIAVPGASDPAQFWHELLQGAERLNAEGIPCLSAHDPRRNPHRKADGWQAATIRAILETRVTPATGCGAGSTESTGSSTRPTPARHGRALQGQRPGHVCVAPGGAVTSASPPQAARDTDDAEDADGSPRPERSDSPAIADCGAVRWRRPPGSGLEGAVVPRARRQALNRWSDLAAVAKAGCWTASSPARPSPASGLQGTYAFMFRRTTSARRAVRVGVVLGIAAPSFLSFGFHREQRCGRTCCSVSAP
jgi:hypothetical protein